VYNPFWLSTPITLKGLPKQKNMSSQREDPRDAIKRKYDEGVNQNHQDYMNMVNAEEKKRNAANGNNSGGCVVLLFAFSSTVVAALFSIYKILG